MTRRLRLILALALLVAAPRSGHESTPPVDVSGWRSAPAPPLAMLDGSGIAGTSSIVTGWATFCDPTPDYCQAWGGDARLGAVPSFTYGDEPYVTEVCAGSRCVFVTVVSYCACGDRGGKPTVIDLSRAAFERIGNPRAGLAWVTVRTADDIRLPATDTKEAT